MEKVILNKLPVPTFGWLGVNKTEREVESPVNTVKKYDVYPDTDGPSRIDITEDGRYEITVSASENTENIVIVYILAKKAQISVNVKASAYSKVRVVEIFENNTAVIAASDAKLDDSAEFETVQLYLGGDDTVSEIKASLDGRSSSFKCDIGYLLADTEKLDINIVASHKGRKTISEIDAKGVMDGRSEKVFRGTIDFIKGASGSKGAENEEVLLMNDSVRNKTVPLILCGEEDVEGSHGASIGRINEEYIFYMQSRGIPAEKIYEIMADARIEQIINRIGDEQTVARIRKALSGSEENE